jgi:predicted nucleotidyltransferase
MVLDMFSPQERVILARLIEAFSTLDEVEEIRVFGSRARGDSSERSDMDIVLITTKKGPGLLRKIQSLKWNALGDPEDFIYVNVLPIYGPAFLREGGLLRNKIEQEGVRLWKRRKLSSFE